MRLAMKSFKQNGKAKTGSRRPAPKPKKSPEELGMIEGPEAFSRFQSVLKAIFSGRGVSRDPASRTPS